jgi:uncharacterized protein VirK/YbjX
MTRSLATLSLTRRYLAKSFSRRPRHEASSYNYAPTPSLGYRDALVRQAQKALVDVEKAFEGAAAELGIHSEEEAMRFAIDFRHSAGSV